MVAGRSGGGHLWTLPIAAVLIGAAAACSGDTAILLEVTGPTGAKVRPDRLAFVLGAKKTVGDKAIFVRDPQSSIEVAVDGRDLDQAPYRLLVHDGQGGAAPLSGAVLGYAGNALVAFGALGEAPFVPDEVLLYRLPLGAASDVTVLDTGCVTWKDGGLVRTITGPDDQDCDGHRAATAGGDDCDDHDPAVHPGAPEVCANGVDDNCDGRVDESPDDDGDGFHLCAGDCDDHDPAVHPGAPERCNGKDDDCNGLCDDGFDADGDGYTTCGTRILEDGTCATGGVPDCNDGDPTIHPGAAETCDGKDNDCNGLCDDGPLDRDGDGFTSCGTLAGLPAPADGVCGAKSPLLVDCKEGTGSANRAVHPFAHESCDGLDDNCDGRLETSEPCYARVSGEGNPCALGTRACTERDGGGGGLSSGCTPAVPEQQADMNLCSAYVDACKDATEPWRCANETAASAILDCQIGYVRISGTTTKPPTATVCAGSVTLVPALGGTEGCAITLVGGTEQEGYRGGLRAPGSAAAPLATYTGCDAELAVVAAQNDLAPQPDEWVLLVADQESGSPALAVVVNVTPAAVAACPAVPMSCKMRTP